MSDQIDLREARRIASEEAATALQKREGRIGNKRDAVRAFHPQILALRKAESSWEEVAKALHRWCGIKIPANTVKTYTSKVNMGTLAAWPADNAPMPPQAGDAVQAEVRARAAAKRVLSIIVEKPTAPDSQSTMRVKADPE